jgi:NADP-dependent 3-hydroxy acid dehydrogenase YdfG
LKQYFINILRYVGQYSNGIIVPLYAILQRLKNAPSGNLRASGNLSWRVDTRGKGHIVNITSDAGRKAFPGLGIYSGSKFFVEAVSQALRSETASSGLRVTCIQPGNVETPLLATSTDKAALKAYGEPTGAKVLEPSDIGRAGVYAVTQPEWCAVNEILVEPREEPA